MKHELKIWPQFYEEVKNKSKTWEYRYNDRNFQKGDTVILREWVREGKTDGFYSGREINANVGYVFPLSSYCIFSLLDVFEVQSEPHFLGETDPKSDGQTLSEQSQVEVAESSFNSELAQMGGQKNEEF